MKKIVIIAVLAVLVIAAAVTCFLLCFQEDESQVGLSKTEWNAMLDSKNFENYTLDLDGNMTSSFDGELQGSSVVKETILFTKDKVKMSLSSESGDPNTYELVMDGEAAAAQKKQFEQIFLALLAEYDSFVYDGASDTYKVNEPLVIELNMAAFKELEDGTVETLELPATIEMRKATVTLSEDGKLMKFVCDYAQAVQSGGGESVISGETTWTFSHYGSTVIE